MKRYLCFLFGSLVFVSLGACHPPASQVKTTTSTSRPAKKPTSDDIPMPSQYQLSAFELDVGDILFIKVYGEDNLEGTFQVYPDCKILFPLLESIDICGRTPGEIRKSIADRLFQDFLKERPSVIVQVKQFNSKKIFVFGEVKQPGRFDYSPNITVVQAIAMAGGFSSRASRDDTRLIRVIGGKRRIYRVPLSGLGKQRVINYYLRPGDLIYIPESWF